jgi:hypothetical protein
MSTLKTLKNDASVKDFLNAVPDEQKRADSFALLDLFTEVTGEPATMWGSSIVGFGMYHYKSERSSQEGDWMLTGFSPRKANLTLYIPLGVQGFEEHAGLLGKLGKHKTSKGCLYINKLTDVDMAVLKKFLTVTYAAAKKRFAT